MEHGILDDKINRKVPSVRRNLSLEVILYRLKIVLLSHEAGFQSPDLKLEWRIDGEQGHPVDLRILIA